jgi:ferredoxin
MKGKIFEKNQLSNFIDDLLKKRKVFAPINQDGFTYFNEIKSSSEVYLDFQSKLSSKEILFPRCETLFTYTKGEGEIKLEEPKVKDEEIVLFGVPPCEAKGFTLIDTAFSSGEFQDIYFSRRRENTIIIGISCQSPRTTCFCTSVGSSPFGRAGVDFLLHDLGEKYLLEIVSMKGETLLDLYKQYENATETDIKMVQRIEKKINESMKTRLALQGIEEKLDNMFEDPLWKNIYEKCVGCGVCTYLCPTCYCFDMFDEHVTSSEGKRIRIWDSCQFPLFTLQGSGENPRPTGKERMRQRMMHKFNYYPKNYDAIACVGCGRCIRECPVNLDIREVLKTITAI